MAAPLLAEAYSQARLDLDSLDKDLKRAQEKLKKAAVNLERLLRLELTVDDTKALATVDRFEKRVQASKARIEATAATLNVDAAVDPEQAAEVGRRAAAAVQAGYGPGALQVTVDIDPSRLTATGAEARALVEAGFGGPLSFNVELDDTTLVAAAARARATVRAAIGDLRLDVNIDDVEAAAELTTEALAIPDAEVEVRLNTERFDENATRVQAQVRALSGRAWFIRFDVRWRQAVADIEKVRAAAFAVSSEAYNVSFDVDTTAAAEAAARAREGAREAAEDVVAKVTADTGQFDSQFAGVQARIQELTTQAVQVTMTADGDQARLEAARVRSDVQDVLGEIIRLVAEFAGDEQVLAELRALYEGAERVDGFVARITAEVRGAAGSIVELGEVGAAARAVPDVVRIRMETDAESLRDLTSVQRFVLGSVQRFEEVLGRTRLTARQRYRAALIAEAVETEATAARERARQATRDARDAADFLRSSQGRLRALEADEREQRRRAAEADLRAQAALREALSLREGGRDAEADTALANARKLERAATQAQERLAEATRRRQRAADAGDAANNARAAARAARAEAREVASFNRRAQREARRLASIGAQDERAATIQLRIEGVAAVIAGARAVDAAVDGIDESKTIRLSESRAGLFKAIAKDVLSLSDALGRLRDDRDQSGSFGLDSLRRAARGITSTFRDLRKQLKVNVAVTGERRVFATFSRILLQKAAVARDIDINVDIDRRGRFASTLTRIRTGLASAFGSIGGGVGRGANSIFSFLSRNLGNAASQVTGVFSSIAESAQGAVATVGEAFTKLQGQLAGLGGALSTALGPITSAIAPVAIAGAILGILPLIAGPLLAGIGALIGAAVGLLASSAIAVLGAGVLPAVAVFLDDVAKDKLKALLEPLKQSLLTEFAATTALVTDVIAPAFATSLGRLIPVAAEGAADFILPITNSLLRTVDLLEPSIRNLAAPIGQGLASVLDTLNRFLPTFDQIALKIGPPLTDALNALLEVTLTLGNVFSDDIASGFQVIADLVREIGPGLQSWAGFITPTLQLLGAIIASIVEAGRQLADQYGGQLADDFRTLAANSQGWISVMVGAGRVLVTLIHYMAVLSEAVSDVREGFQRFRAALTQGLGTAVATVLRAVSAGLAFLVETFAKQILRVVKIASNIPGAQVFADQLTAVAGGAQAALNGVEAFSDGVDLYADALEGSTRATADNLRLTADLESQLRDKTKRAMEEGRLSTQSYRLEVEALTARLRADQITQADYNKILDELARAVPTVAQKFPVASKALEDFNKKLSEGELAASKFADSVRRELPKASDFVTEAVDPTEATSVAAELQEQARRDAEDVQFAAEDYNAAVAEAQRLRAEGNTEAIRGAEEEVRRLQRGLTDAQRAAQDSAAEAATGGVEPVRRQTIDITKAIEESGRQVAEAAAKARTLVELRSRGDGEFNPIADFLADLDPEQFVQAIDQLGGTTSEAFRLANEKIAGQVRQGTLSVEELLAARRRAIQLEGERVARLAALEDGGLGFLAKDLEGLSPEDFKVAYEGLFSQGLGAVAAANEESKNLTIAAGEVASQALQNQIEATEGEVLAAQREIANGVKGEAERAAQGIRDAFAGAFTGKGLGEILTNTNLGDESADPEVLAGIKGAAAGTTFAAEFGKGIANIGTETVRQAAAAAQNLDVAAFTAPGQSAGFNFSQGFRQGVLGSGGGGIGGPILNAGGIPGAVAGQAGLLASDATLGQFAAAGRRIGSAVIAGVVQGFNADGATIDAAITLYVEGVRSQVDEWADVGTELGEAFVRALARAILDGARLTAEAARVLARTAGFAFLAEYGTTLRPLAGVASGALAAATAQAATRATVDGRLIGQAFVLGLQLGMIEKLGELSRIVVSIAQAIANAVRLTLGVRSPSTVMATVGDQIIAGLVVGIERSSSKAVEAATDAARAAADAAAVQSTGVAAVTAASDIITLPVAPQRNFDRRPGGALGQFFYEGQWYDDTVERMRSTVSTGMTLGAGLPEQVSSAAAAAQQTFNQQTGTVDNTVVENNTWNITATSPEETAAEVARRQRTRKYLLRGRRG